MKEKNQLDELFHSRLKDFEQEPPSYVWSRIQEKQEGKKRRLAILYWKVSGIAAAVLLAFIFGWQLRQSQKDLSPNLANDRVPENVAAPIASTPVQGNRTGLEEKPENQPQRNTTESLQLATTGGSSKTNSESKLTSQKELQVAQQMSYTDQTNASISHEKIAQRLDENRKQNNDQLELLRLLNIKLDHQFDNKQLGEVGQKQSESKQLSHIEQDVVNENARLLASNLENKKSGSWQVGAMITPGYNVNQGSQDKLYASNMTYTGSKENVQLGGGILVEYKTGKRWSLQSGVYYNKLGQSSSNQPYRSNNDLLYATAPGGWNETTAIEAEYFNTAINVKSGEMSLNTAVGVVAVDNLPSNAHISNSFDNAAESRGVLLTETDFQQNFEYIEIPLILRYLIVDSDFELQLLGGINTSLLVGNNAYAIDASGKERIGSTQDMNSVNYSTTIGLGVGYGLTKNLNLLVEPQLKYYLGSLSNNSNISFKPYTISVSTGLSYHF